MSSIFKRDEFKFGLIYAIMLQDYFFCVFNGITWLFVTAADIFYDVCAIIFKYYLIQTLLGWNLEFYYVPERNVDLCSWNLWKWTFLEDWGTS